MRLLLYLNLCKFMIEWSVWYVGLAILVVHPEYFGVGMIEHVAGGICFYSPLFLRDCRFPKKWEKKQPSWPSYPFSSLYPTVHQAVECRKHYVEGCPCWKNICSKALMADCASGPVGFAECRNSIILCCSLAYRREPLIVLTCLCAWESLEILLKMRIWKLH